MKSVPYILLSACLLLFCGAGNRSEPLQLLPQPQKIVIHPSGKHRLRQGAPDPSVVTERMVASISEAEVNPDEAYRLRITSDSIVIEATTEQGIFRARQTLSQIIASGNGRSLPALEITDWPAFRVRGFMHDVGRSFITVEELKKQIAILAKFKINVFHWHLTENQGWRLESKRYPQLNDSSSFARLPGKYYTIADAHEIAAYCKAHHMLLIPEVDMPGHSAAIDSRFHYINHFDAFGDIVALYNSKIYNSIMGNDDLAGAILAIWNDRMLEDETQIMLQNHFYPNILALAERAWRGGGSEYFDKNGVILPTDDKDPVYRSFADFERRMLWHKTNTFADIDFPYVKQTDIRWSVTDPFPNGGDLSAEFPPEKAMSDSFTYNGQTYGTHPAVGAGIYLRHVWGVTVPAFYDDPKENHTAYAWTWVWSPRKQTVGLWTTTQDYSRSESDLPPPQGEWDYRKSRVWLNNIAITPPKWENSHTQKSNEITLKNENFTARRPLPVQLKRGWNKVLLKLPIGKFSTPEVRLQKWMFTFVFVTPDGRERVGSLVYSPEKKR